MDCPPSPARPPGSPQRASSSAWPIPTAGLDGLSLGGGSGGSSVDGAATFSGERTPYRILLVDDDPATLMAMKRHLLRMRGPVQYQGARWFLLFCWGLWRACVRCARVALTCTLCALPQ
jgi:hypothetical protein